ncbi:MAG: undecaprenyl-diphosphate phosphatase, partial [Bacteroidales bacterium]|nr:undecaprenyl-diphosphate phosphatase [Bacteroidales bacterium]
MSWFEALLLGLIQGFTEFLPVSSSGHLELGKHFLQIETEQSLSFTVVVHGATVLSTIVVFWKEIRDLFSGFITFKWNNENKYIVKILVSIIPVGFIGLFFEEEVKQFFTGNIVFVGAMLLVTATLLSLTYISKSRGKNISFLDAFIIGIAQAFAVLPG